VKYKHKNNQSFTEETKDFVQWMEDNNNKNKDSLKDKTDIEVFVK